MGQHYVVAVPLSGGTDQSCGSIMSLLYLYQQALTNLVTALCRCCTVPLSAGTDQSWDSIMSLLYLFQEALTNLVTALLYVVAVPFSPDTVQSCDSIMSRSSLSHQALSNLMTALCGGCPFRNIRCPILWHSIPLALIRQYARNSCCR